MGFSALTTIPCPLLKLSLVGIESSGREDSCQCLGLLCIPRCSHLSEHESVTRFSHAQSGASPPQKPACGFPAQASSVSHSSDRILACLAIRSIPVVVIVSPLSVNNVAIECSTHCAPLRSMGVTPLLHYYESIRLPMNRWASFGLTRCVALLPVGRTHGISRVPDSPLMTCHGLRPRWTLGSLGRWLLWYCLPHC